MYDKNILLAVGAVMVAATGFTHRSARHAFAFTTSFGRFIGAGVNFLLGSMIHSYGSLGIPVATTALAFVVGLLIIPFAMETKGQRLPE